MANVFNIKITAIDNATKVVNKVNKNVAAMFAPYDKAKQSAKSFFGAVGKNDFVKRTGSGFESIGQSILGVGKSFGVAEESIVGGAMNFGSQLLTMGGAWGAVAGAAAVSTVAIEGAGVKMAKTGLDIVRTSRSLGMTTDRLQEFRGAAQMAGLSTESMDSSLSSLGSTLQDAAVGRNRQAATMLSQMGVSIRRDKNGVVDTALAYRDLSGVISKIADPNIQKEITDVFGMGEMLPLIREGGSALDNYIATARRVGLVQSVEQVEANKRAADSWNHLKTAVDGLGTSLGNVIAKHAHIDSIADWIDDMARTDPPKSYSSNGPRRGYLSGGSATPQSPRRGYLSGPTNVPIGMRNNNPTNLRSWAGAGSNGGYAVFPTAGEGLVAAAKNLVGYQDKYGINTINGIVNRWAPSADKNNVPAYVGDVSNATGFSVNQGLNLHDPSVLAPLLSSIVKHENGQNPFSAKEIGDAVAQALRENQSNQPVSIKVEGLPTGMSISPVRGLGQVNVGRTMAPGGVS